jgi:hypothetical protein
MLPQPRPIPQRDTGGEQQLVRLGLPEAIVSRLAGEGVHTLSDWRALGAGRKGIFGVTASTVKTLDELARGSPA